MRYVKNSDLWKTSIQYTYLNGTWQRIRDVSGNVNGVWKSTIPPIGTFVEGGYVAGIIDTLASGGERYIVLVSPKEYQMFNQWSVNYQTYTGNNAVSKWNGLENTAKLANANYPAANYCATLNINGANDWYLPAVDELELIHRNLKPTVYDNYTAISEAYNQTTGYNPSSDPIGSGYTSTVPARTNIGIFQEGQSQSMWPPRFQTSTLITYWTSTNFNIRNAYRIYFTRSVSSNGWTGDTYIVGTGRQETDYAIGSKSDQRYTRPIRRVII